MITNMNIANDLLALNLPLDKLLDKVLDHEELIFCYEASYENEPALYVFSDQSAIMFKEKDAIEMFFANGNKENQS